MNFTWEQAWKYVNALPNDTTTETTIRASLIGMLVNLEEEAEAGVFYLVTPRIGQVFAIQSNSQGLSIGFPVGVDLNAEAYKFQKYYGENQLSLLSSFEWKKIS